MATAILEVGDCIAAALVLVALVVWATRLFPSLGRVDFGEARTQVFRSCAVFGAGYGAVLASFYGMALVLGAHPAEGPPWDLISGVVVCGAALGAFGGGVAGFFGTVRGRHMSWCLAGIVGGAAPSACVWMGCALGAAFAEESGTKDMLWAALVACTVILLISGSLGAALDRALQNGRSSVPGVQRLAANVRRIDQREGTP